MRKLVAEHISTFPLPVHSGKREFWHLSAVLLWCVSERIREIEPSILDLTSVNMQLNLGREKGSLDPEIQSALTMQVH